LKKHEDPKRIELPAMFSWLSTQIPEYPDTLNLNMYAHIQETGLRPHFRSQPRSRQYHKGITPERVKEIMLARLRGNEQEGRTTVLSLGSALSPFRRDTRTINAVHPVNLKCWQTLPARCLVSEP
jgi:hypothetical protein